jgi:erythromycin esterase-like protein
MSVVPTSNSIRSLSIGWINLILVASLLIGCNKTVKKELTLTNFVNDELVVLNSDDPSNNNYDDLTQVAKSLKDVKVVFIGEQDHGDGKTFLAKTRLIKFLVERMGFSSIIFEGDFFALYQINQTSTNDKSINLRNNLYSHWRLCSQMDPFFDYIQNRSNLSVVGMDCRLSSQHSKQEFINYFVGKINQGKFRPKNQILFLAVLNDVIKNEYKSTSTIEDRAYFLEELNFIDRKIGVESDVFFRQNVKNLIAFCQNAWETTFTSNIRDKQMAENIFWLMAQNPNTKFIVWTHNYHALKNFNQVKTERYKNDSLTVGTLVHKKLGDRSFSIATISSGGTGGRIGFDKFQISPPLKGSLEFEIMHKGAKSGFLNFKEFQNSSLGDSSFSMNGFFHIPDSEKWLKLFDGIYYIQEMSPCTDN